MGGADEGMEAFYAVQELTYIHSYPEAYQAALDLNIPDIQTAGKVEPLTPHQVADRLPHTSHDAAELPHRILRLLARHGLFSQIPASDPLSTQYGLNVVSRNLVTSSEFDVKPYVRMMQRRDIVAPLAHLRETVDKGKNAFVLPSVMQVWKYASEKPVFNKMFNADMSSQAELVNSAIARGYEGLREVLCLLEVGGGVGCAWAQIVSAYPHIRGGNFDLGRTHIENIGGPTN